LPKRELRASPRLPFARYERAGPEIAEKGHFWMETNSAYVLRFLRLIDHIDPEMDRYLKR
jgi:hypothetical protein